MPVHRHDGTNFTDQFARVYSDSFTDTNDKMWAWDGTIWQLIQPVSIIVPPGGFLPPENVTPFDITDHAVSIGWDDPTQPETEPTHVQYRFVEITSVWTEVPHPSPTVHHNALDDDTFYTFEVRYIVRTDGEVVLTSDSAFGTFTTDHDDISNPGDGPGPGPGDTVFPGDDTDDPDCDWEWKLQIFDLDAFGWIDTDPLVTGTVDGDEDPTYDMSLLPPGTYRFARREVCLGIPGDWDYGDPFPAPTDWDAACAGILNSLSASRAPFLDAVWQIPKVCVNDDDEMVMLDGVSGLELAKGPNFGAFGYDSDAEWGIISSDLDNSPAVYEGALPAVFDAVQPGQDWTVSLDFRFAPTFDNFSAGYQTLKRWAALHEIGLVYGVASCSVKAKVRLDDFTELELDTDQIAYTAGLWHTATLRFIDGGLVSLWVHGDKEDEDTPSTGIYDGTIGTTIKGHLPNGMTLRRHYGWDRALTDNEINDIASTNVTNSFTQVGNNDIVIPTGVTQIGVELYGAQGGNQSGADGGKGGYLRTRHTVTPGETIRVVVGGTTSTRAGGGNGGGTAAGAGNGKGGGGATDIRRTPYATANRLAVAAGGGGAATTSTGTGGDWAGGAGNGNGSGADGADPPDVEVTPGLGGTLIAGGAGGTSDSTWSYQHGHAGTLGSGGQGGDYNSGGGGGGIYGGGGGGGGSPASGGGGGGSGGKLDGTALLLGFKLGDKAGSGLARITWFGPEYTFEDDYNRANAATIGGNNGWQTTGSPVGSVQALVSNALHGTALQSISVRSPSNSVYNNYAEADVVACPAGSMAGLVTRWSDFNHNYRGRMNRVGSDKYEIVRSVSGVETVLATLVEAAPGSTYRLRFAAIGSELTLSVWNGASWDEKLQVTDGQWGNGYDGIYTNAAGGTVIMDNFKQGNT